jgi:WD40 repeat protein
MTPLSIGHDSGDQWEANRWSLSAGQPTKTLLAAKAPLLAMAISPDGKTFAVSRLRTSSDVLVCDAQTGELLRELAAQKAAVRGLAFIGNDLLAAASADGTVRTWNWRTGEEADPLPTNTSLALWCLAASPDGRWLAAGTAASQVALWDVRSRERRVLAAGSGGRIEGLAFSPGSNMLAVAGPGNASSVWPLESDAPMKRLTGHAQAVTAVVFSHDGRSLASGSKDGTVIVWDVATWEPKLTLSTGSVSVQSVAFTHDDTALLAGRMDGRVHVWRGSPSVPITKSIETMEAVSP